MKKQYSLQFEFLSIIISAVLVIAVLVGGLALFETNRVIVDSTKELTKLTIQKESQRINDVFDGMERSVRIMRSYVFDFISEKSDFTSPQKQEEIIKASEKMFKELADNTEGTIAYYLRFAPEISDNVSGLFYTKTKRESNFTKFEPTDLSLYDKNDIEHVGWYWEPFNKGAPVWMMPYYNKNIDAMMISYVIPLYYDNVFIGVVGMDFNYNVLTAAVDAIKLYDNGFAYLKSENSITHHKILEAGAPAPDMTKEYICEEALLKNGMTLVVSASYEDIQNIKNRIIGQIVLMVVIFALCVSVIAVLIVKRFSNPIKVLTDSAVKLSNGDYGVEIIHSNTKEIELLSTAFEDMAIRLSEHDRLQHLIAYRDSLTGLRNTASYKAWVEDFEKVLDGDKGQAFGVVVIDINYLKETNDKYGHDNGNKLIVAVSKIISDIFKRSPVFRIGGDEFLVILQNRDLLEYSNLIHKLKQKFSTETIQIGIESVPVSAACGVAIYNSDIDNSFANVFNRADDIMYQNKREMKEKF